MDYKSDGTLWTNVYDTYCLSTSVYVHQRKIAYDDMDFGMFSIFVWYYMALYTGQCTIMYTIYYMGTEFTLYTVHYLLDVSFNGFQSFTYSVFSHTIAIHFSMCETRKSTGWLKPLQSKYLENYRHIWNLNDPISIYKAVHLL